MDENLLDNEVQKKPKQKIYIILNIALLLLNVFLYSIFVKGERDLIGNFSVAITSHFTYLLVSFLLGVIISLLSRKKFSITFILKYSLIILLVLEVLTFIGSLRLVVYTYLGLY